MFHPSGKFAFVPSTLREPSARVHGFQAVRTNRTLLLTSTDEQSKAPPKHLSLPRRELDTECVCLGVRRFGPTGKRQCFFLFTERNGFSSPVKAIPRAFPTTSLPYLLCQSVTGASPEKRDRWKVEGMRNVEWLKKKKMERLFAKTIGRFLIPDQNTPMTICATRHR